jgi:ribosomal protein L16/L10AE
MLNKNTEFCVQRPKVLRVGNGKGRMGKWAMNVPGNVEMEMNATLGDK